MQTITGKEIKLLPEIIFDNVNGKLNGNEPFTIEFSDLVNPPKTATELSAYIDFSIPLFFLENGINIIFNDEITNSIISILFKDCRLEFNMEKKDYDYEHKHYIFYNKSKMNIEYHQDKSKKEKAYFRLSISISIEKINKD